MIFPLETYSDNFIDFNAYSSIDTNNPPYVEFNTRSGYFLGRYHYIKYLNW
jgi:hypothetical protein